MWTLSNTETEWIDVSGLVDKLTPEPKWTQQQLEERTAQMHNRPRVKAHRPPFNGRRKPRDYWSDERRAKISLIHKGRTRNPRTLQQREACQRYWTPERRAAASARVKAEVAAMTPEQRERRFWRNGKPIPFEERSRNSKAMWTPEFRARQSAASKAAWEALSPEEKKARVKRLELTPKERGRISRKAWTAERKAKAAPRV